MWACNTGPRISPCWRRGLIGYVLSSWLSSADLDAWGWRLAFLLGAAVVPVGLIIRRSLPETLGRPDAGGGPAPNPTAPMRIVVLGLMMLAATSISIYVIEYIATYAQDSLHMPARLAFGATVTTRAGQPGVRCRRRRPQRPASGASR